MNLALAALVAFGLGAGPAVAADAAPWVDVQQWTLPLDADGLLWTSDAEAPRSGWFVVGTTGSWQLRPVEYALSDGTVEGVIDHVVGWSARGAVAVGPARVGLDVPLLVGVAGAEAERGVSVGDVLLDAKVRVVPRATPVGVAALGRVWLPTAGWAGAPWADARARYELAVVADVEAGPVRVAANVGTRGQPPADLGDGHVVDDAFVARAGVAWALGPPVALSADLAAAVPYALSADTPNVVPVEVLVGATARVGGPWVARVGAGRGLTRGLGAPDARVVLAVEWAASRSPDADGDGVVDARDACPRDPEDLDGFEDADGCPDPDDDRDGVADLDDACPREPEDLDGVDDDDGCPESATRFVVRAFDPDHAAVAAAEVTVEPAEGFGGATGKGEVSVVVGPGRYHAAARAEGYDDAALDVDVVAGPVSVHDLTLEPARRGTLVVRVLDPSGASLTTASWRDPGGLALPPMEGGVGRVTLPAGTHQLYAQAPGYAPARFPAVVEAGREVAQAVTLRPARVTVTREKLVFTDKVYFDTGRATLRAESRPLLDEIAAVLAVRDDALLVRVEGHTDSRGDAAMNQGLSEHRAEAVRDYLVTAGIAPGRLRFVGYGESRPIDPRETSAAWDRNRRVELYIERWAE